MSEPMYDEPLPASYENADIFNQEATPPQVNTEIDDQEITQKQEITAPPPSIPPLPPQDEPNKKAGASATADSLIKNDEFNIETTAEPIVSATTYEEENQSANSRINNNDQEDHSIDPDLEIQTPLNPQDEAVTNEKENRTFFQRLYPDDYILCKHIPLARVITLALWFWMVVYGGIDFTIQYICTDGGKALLYLTIISSTMYILYCVLSPYPWPLTYTFAQAQGFKHGVWCALYAYYQGILCAIGMLVAFLILLTWMIPLEDLLAWNCSRPAQEQVSNLGVNVGGYLGGK